MDSVRNFAETVAPLYIGNNWLGLGNATFSEAIDHLVNMIYPIYQQVVDFPVDEDSSYYFVSTGRVMVIKFYWSDGPAEIQITLNLETEVEHEGRFLNVFSEEFA